MSGEASEIQKKIREQYKKELYLNTTHKRIFITQDTIKPDWLDSVIFWNDEELHLFIKRCEENNANNITKKQNIKKKTIKEIPYIINKCDNNFLKQNEERNSSQEIQNYLFTLILFLEKNNKQSIADEYKKLYKSYWYKDKDAKISNYRSNYFQTNYNTKDENIDQQINNEFKTYLKNKLYEKPLEEGMKSLYRDLKTEGNSRLSKNYKKDFRKLNKYRKSNNTEKILYYEKSLIKKIFEDIAKYNDIWTQAVNTSSPKDIIETQNFVCLWKTILAYTLFQKYWFNVGIAVSYRHIAIIITLNNGEKLYLDMTTYLNFNEEDFNIKNFKWKITIYEWEITENILMAKLMHNITNTCNCEENDEIISLEKAHKLAPDDVDILYSLAFAYQKNNEYQKAYNLYNEIITNNKNTSNTSIQHTIKNTKNQIKILQKNLK